MEKKKLSNFVAELINITMKTLQELTRPNIWSLAPYSSARNEYSGHVAHVFLDANENPYNDPYNRYPDPLQQEVKERISQIKNVPEECIFLGNGSDEAIDLIYRIFCQPRVDNVVAISPSYGMYQVCADINDVEYRPVALTSDFQIDRHAIVDRIGVHTKVLWICSPNNPTGNAFDIEEIEWFLQKFPNKIIVIDEAYIDFSSKPSLLSVLDKYENLIVLQTLSKAWGQAAIRCGIAYASEAIIAYFNNVKYPYNVNLLTQQQAVKVLAHPEKQKKQVEEILAQREIVHDLLISLPCVEKIYPSDANFLLVKVNDANAIYLYLQTKGIIVRNRHKVQLCGNCLRITVGTPEENASLFEALKAYK